MRFFFVSYPLFSHNQAALPYIKALIDVGYTVDYFNTSDYGDFIESEHCDFYAYPSYHGLGTDTLNKDFTFFQLGLSILESVESVQGFLEEKIKERKPEFIIHSKFCLWARLLADKYEIPRFNLVSGFVFNPRKLTRDFKLKAGQLDSKGLMEGKCFHEKLQEIQSAYPLTDLLYEDVFENREPVNFVMNLKEFQPNLEDYDDGYNFIGMSLPKAEALSEKQNVYISIGTVFNEDKELLEIFIDCLRDFAGDVILFLRNKPKNLPDNFKIAEMGSQLEHLTNAKLFITHGGACSILESIKYHAPLLVLPQTIEHEINGKNVEELGIGLTLQLGDVDKELLRDKINQLLEQSSFMNRIIEFAIDNNGDNRALFLETIQESLQKVEK